MTTATMTLISLGPTATAYVGAGPLPIQAKPLGSDGLTSGSKVRLASSDRTIAQVTSAEQLGAAPVGVVGLKVGTATITATADDNTGVTATLVVTVS